MKSKSWLAIVPLFMLACGEELPLGPSEAPPGIPQRPVVSAGDAERDDAPVGVAARNVLESSDDSDYYHCYESGQCAAPALSSSTRCLNGRDYETSTTNLSSNVIVLSFHGGSIEPHSTEVAAALASRFNFNHYNFAAHGTAACLGEMNDFWRLHITATKFDDPVALSLVQSHTKAVAIHGYKASRNNYRGTICVGGANTAQVAEFIASVEKNVDGFDEYRLRAVDAANATPVAGVDCGGLEGKKSANLVNRVANVQGGLQLEMSDGIKADLIDPDAKYDALRNVIYDSVNAAMSK